MRTSDGLVDLELCGGGVYDRRCLRDRTWVGPLSLGLPEAEGLLVALDTESSGLHWDDWAYGCQGPTGFRNRLSVISVAYVDDRGMIWARAFPFDQERVEEKNGTQDSVLFSGVGGPDPNLGLSAYRELLAWLGRQQLIMHHAKHDLHVLRAGTRMGWSGWEPTEAEQVHWDTMLADWVLHPLDTHNLEDVSARELGESKTPERDRLRTEIKKSKGRYGTLSNPRYDLIPWTVMEPYAARDAELTLRLCLKQMHDFASQPDLKGVFLEEMDVMWTLVGMERRGIGYDVGRSNRAAAKAGDLAAEVAKGLPFVPTPDNAAHWFYEVKDAVPHCKTEVKQRPSTRECCVRQLQRSPDDEIRQTADTYAKLVKIEHAISKYYQGWAEGTGDDGRLRTDFRQTGTVNFRFSSQRHNLQAIPHDYRLALVEGVETPRAMFKPEEGHELWEHDLEQAELRAATSYARCKRMWEYLESGADVHGETARLLFGVVPGSEAFHQWRQVSKRCNFALVYSVGATTFDQDVERNTGVRLGQDRAKEIIGEWRKLYPEFPRINERAESRARARGYVKLWDDRVRFFTSTEMQFELYKSFSAVIQGGIAQLVKRWMVAVDRELPGMLLLQIHDSLVTEIHREEVEHVRELIEKVGMELAEAAFGIRMPVASKKWEYADSGEPPEDVPARPVQKGWRDANRENLR